MSKRSRVRDVAYRLMAAVAIGLTVAGTAYLSGFYLQRGLYLGQVGKGMITRTLLNFLERQIERHREATGHPPVTLAELEIIKEGHDFEVDGQGRVLDPWKHPYQYRVEGERFILFSFGADGLPGGAGIDADVYPTSSGRRLELPTLRQFTFDFPTGGLRWTCVVAGLCAGLVCLQPPVGGHKARFLVRVGATLVGAVFIALVVSVVHIPNGH